MISQHLCTFHWFKGFTLTRISSDHCALPKYGGHCQNRHPIYNTFRHVVIYWQLQKLHRQMCIIFKRVTNLSVGRFKNTGRCRNRWNELMIELMWEWHRSDMGWCTFPYLSLYRSCNLFHHFPSGKWSVPPYQIACISDIARWELNYCGQRYEIQKKGKLIRVAKEFWALEE